MPLDADVVLAEAHAFPIGQAHQINSNGDVAVIFRELRRAVRVDDPVLQAIRRKAVIDEVGPVNSSTAFGEASHMLVAPDDVSDFGEPVVVLAVVWLACRANITIVPEGGRLETLGDPQRREVDGVVTASVEDDAPPTDDGTASNNVRRGPRCLGSSCRDGPACSAGAVRTITSTKNAARERQPFSNRPSPPSSSTGRLPRRQRAAPSAALRGGRDRRARNAAPRRRRALELRWWSRVSCARRRWASTADRIVFDACTSVATSVCAMTERADGARLPRACARRFEAVHRLSPGPT